MSETIGARVKRFRVERGLTQEKLAGAAEVSASTIARLERDKIVSDTGTLERIAKVLGRDVGELLGDTALPARREDLYPSLDAFLARYGEVMAVSASERAWLTSQVFTIGDIGDPEWWMAQLSLYRSQVRATSSARMLVTASAPDSPRPKH